MKAVLSVVLIAAFFLPWVSWDGIPISGADMPLGKFFRVSGENFMLANPFPQYDFALFLFWLIPALAVFILILTLQNRSGMLVAALAGILTLSLVTVYILFTNVLTDLGVKHEFKWGLYLAILGAAGIIIAGSQGWLRKIVLLLVGPVIAWAGFMAISSHLENEEFSDTANAKAEYTVTANDLIREFMASDSTANAKYREKIISVSGNISALEKPNDSTVNIKFIDTTSGSYAIFPFVNESAKEVQGLKEGEPVSIKGSCSGGVYSQILGTEFITFKRCVLNKD